MYSNSNDYSTGLAGKPCALAAWLGYAGLLPFIITLACTLTGFTLLGFDPRWVFASYSALIASFLAGVLWGRVLTAGSLRLSRASLLFSNVITLLAWGSLLLLLAAPRSALGALALCYLALLLWDWRWFPQLYAGVSRRYYILRLTLTAIVVGCHFVMLLALLPAVPAWKEG